jgi:hypothetical protein
VFLVHGWNGLALSAPRYFPEVPVRFDLTGLLSDAPWVYATHHLAISTVYFTVVGVMFFLSGPVSFSLWFFFILFQVYRMILGTATGDPSTPGHADAHFGGVLAFALIALWIGRHHWKLVIAQALRGPRAGEPRGRYLSFPFAFWGLVACAAAMVAWLALAGATVIGAAVVVLLLLMLFFTITRIIADTGLVHGQLGVPIYKPFQFAAVAGWPNAVPTQTFFLTSMVHASHFHFREVLAVYAAHGMRVADQTIYGGRSAGRDDSPAVRHAGRRLMLLMVVALAVGYVVSFGSTLWTNYTHAWTKDVSEMMPINPWAMEPHMRGAILVSTDTFDRDAYQVRHNPAGHFTFGFLFVGLLGFLRLSYTWWPLHPVGYLMVGSFPGNVLWFSILIGWLCKMLIVRFGGAGMYLGARPFFIGLIVGESIAAGFWLIVGIFLSALEVPYAPVRNLPW